MASSSSQPNSPSSSQTTIASSSSMPSAPSSPSNSPQPVAPSSSQTTIASSSSMPSAPSSPSNSPQPVAPSSSQPSAPSSTQASAPPQPAAYSLLQPSASTSSQPQPVVSSPLQLSTPSSSQPVAPSSTQASAPPQPATSSLLQPRAPTSSQLQAVVSSPLQPSAPSSSQPQPVASSSSQPSAPSSSRPVATSTQPSALTEQNKKDLKKYLPLYKAILEGNLEFVRQLCDQDNHALEARITVNLDTALHIAVGTGRGNHIVQYLVDNMLTDQVIQKNNAGNTVLSVAAIVGNLEAAKMIMMKDNKHQSLIEESNKSERIPLIEAARHGQKKMITYLLQFSDKYLNYVTGTKFQFDSGVSFINLLITAGFYDLALELLQNYKGSLATKQLSTGESLLSAIAGKQSAFASGRRRKLKFWPYLNPYKLPSHLREVTEKELKYDKALKLVKHLCEEITKNLDYEQASSILKPPLLLAAELGICEVVEEIIKSFPDAVWFTNDKKRNVFQLAVMKRQEKVFNLIFRMSDHKNLLLMSHDDGENNILHLAGRLAPLNQLNLVPGAALQMQRELRWFKEVQKIVQPDYKTDLNSEGETPEIVFTKKHKKLVKEGEKWMKGTATSCSVAAALIATVVFAASITVPSYYNDNGQTNNYKEVAFRIFSISDAISLSSSISAIIMFLSILTARYAEYDFLHSLPKKLVWGLFMLFLSLISLMVAFCATVYLVYADRKAPNGIRISVVILALVPVFTYAFSQLPLFWELFISTYCPRIFRRQNKNVFY